MMVMSITWTWTWTWTWWVVVLCEEGDTVVEAVVEAGVDKFMIRSLCDSRLPPSHNFAPPTPGSPSEFL